jgi:hypothetical protein
MVKITTLIMGAFFCFIVVPSYVKAEKPEWETAGGMSTSSRLTSHLSPLISYAFILTRSPLIKHANPSSVALCGIIPIFFVAYTTAPFVTHIHVHLPPYARTSRAILERFVHSLPPSTELTLTTMSAIGKPRYSNLKAGDLVPTRKRFGIINYERDTAAENATRRWYNFRAVGNFYVQDTQPVRKVRYEKKLDKVDTWVWDAIKDKIQRKARAEAV